MSSKLIAAIAAIVAAAIGIWLVSRASPPPPAADSTPAATSTIAATVQAASTPTPGHRLAGTVVGDVEYAIIEDPDGGNELYHLGEKVPGLGALIAIRAKSVTFSGSNGEYEMKLIPAPTATPGAVGQDARGSRDRDDPDLGVVEDGDARDDLEDRDYDDAEYDDDEEEYLDGADTYIDDRR